MSKSDLTPIRERLESMKRSSEASPQLSEPLWQQARSPELPITRPPLPEPPQLTATMQALQQRSGQAEIHVSNSFQTEESEPEPMPPTVNLHWQRLQQEAALINELAQKQAIAVQNFKRSADRLDWSLRRQPADPRFDFEHLCELQEALVPQVVQTENGKIILDSTPVDLYQDERHASQTAREIRAFSQGRERRPGGISAALPAMNSTLGMLNRLWHTLTHTLETRSRLTLIDIGLWFGGGLIGRLALELLLAAAPSLWPLLVGAMLGIVALALYRLLLVPQPDVAFVVRLFLALVGLALGSQL